VNDLKFKIIRDANVEKQKNNLKIRFIGDLSGFDVLLPMSVILIQRQDKEKNELKKKVIELMKTIGETS
jgi:hypothetical protein